MAKALTCFPFLLRRCKSLTVNNDSLQFCYSVLGDLKNLEQSLADQGSVSLQWSTDMMKLVRKMQVEFLELVHRHEHLLDEYMKETVMLLDLCNLVKKAVSRIKRYWMAVDFTTRKLADDMPVTEYILEMKRLESESEKLVNFDNWGCSVLDKSMFECRKCKKHACPVVFAIKGTVIIIFLLFISAFLSPLPIDMDEYLGPEFHHLGPFTASLIALICQFRERFQSPRGNVVLGIAEIRMVETAIGELKEQIAAAGVAQNRGEVLRCVDMLKRRSVALKEGLEMFDSAANEVFEEVMKGRKKLSATISP